MRRVLAPERNVAPRGGIDPEDPLRVAPRSPAGAVLILACATRTFQRAPSSGTASAPGAPCGSSATARSPTRTDHGVSVAAATPGSVSIAPSTPGSSGRGGRSRGPAVISTGVAGSASLTDASPRVSVTSAAGGGSGRSKRSPTIRITSGLTRTISSTARRNASATSPSRMFRPPTARS